MKIFITGATGFIGRNLVGRLVREGHEVVCGGRSFSKLGSLSGKVKTRRINLENKQTIRDALKGEKYSVLYHCAALVESANLEKLMRVNAGGTRNVFESCLEEGIKKIIYISTVAVVSGNSDVPLTEHLPYKATNPYGESKIEAEKIALSYRKKGIDVAIIRPCMVYGAGEPHGFEKLIQTLKMRVFPVFGKGDAKLHLVLVENVVDVLALCLEKGNAYEGTYFVADREVLTMKEMLNYITGLLKIKPPYVIPEIAVKFLKKIPFIGKKVSFFLKDRVYSIEALLERLSYTPRVSVYDGLKETVLAYEREVRYA